MDIVLKYNKLRIFSLFSRDIILLVTYITNSFSYIIYVKHFLDFFIICNIFSLFIIVLMFITLTCLSELTYFHIYDYKFVRNIQNNL